MMAKLILMLSTIWTLGTVGVDVPTGDLIIVVRELKSTEGQVGILVFNKEDGFPAEREMAVRDVLLPIKNGVIQHTFSGLPFGEYAVAVMHDENKNNELDTNFFGVPKEGNGVSNNVVNPLGPPKFQKAVFSLNQKSHAIEINMRY
jgi:uncharacterized protein (DUF2141 family)